MKDRIREIMESEDYTPARFADTLDIGRAIISHILNGRNNPSLDVISRILEAFPAINPDWLLFGSGNMYRNDMSDGSSAPYSSTDRMPLDLFSQPELVKEEVKKENISSYSPPIRQNPDNTDIHKPVESTTAPNLSQTNNVINEMVNERIVYKDTPAKKIAQIIIYYDDNTFEVFNR